MPLFVVDSDTSLPFIHHGAKNGRPTFVFVNSSGATGAVWEKGIVPVMVARDFGTLTVDFRGQGESRFPAGSTFETEEIVSDLEALVRAEVTGPVILVGLSVGGLRAAHLARRLPNVRGLVLINCLRKQSHLTDWLGALENRLIAMGGTQLVHDCFRPVTVGIEELGRIRPRHLRDEPYEPMAPDHPRRLLAEGAAKADWDFPWSALDMPVLVLTGMRDRLFRVEDHVDEIMAGMQNVREVRFPEAGHALHSEEPERSAREIMSFVEYSLAVAE